MKSTALFACGGPVDFSSQYCSNEVWYESLCVCINSVIRYNEAEMALHCKAEKDILLVLALEGSM